MRTLQLLTALTCGAVLGTAAPLPAPAAAPAPIALAPVVAAAPDVVRGPAAPLRAPTAEAPAASAAHAWADTLPAAPTTELALPGPYPRRDALASARGGSIIRISESSGTPAAARRADGACPRPGAPGYTGTIICIREAEQ
ncbi:MAG TPA: hypothetical protein VFX29_06040 [Longimicrobiaceae bacterium]|nr:hypothetical protein [Longimicrobiaceae bacterium]